MPQSRIPPTAVGGSFRPNLQERFLLWFCNSANGSWWILQVQPCVAQDLRVRQDLNNPPASRWRDSVIRRSLLYSLDLNESPNCRSSGIRLLAKPRHAEINVISSGFLGEAIWIRFDDMIVKLPEAYARIALPQVVTAAMVHFRPGRLIENLRRSY